MWNCFVVLFPLFFGIDLTFSRISLETSTIDFKHLLEEELSKDSGCKISLNKDLSLKQPLFLVPGTTRYFTPIINTTDLLFHEGELIELFCTRGFADSKAHSIVTSCNGNDEFVYGDELYNISQLSCKSPAFHVAIRTDERCFNNGTLVKIGFELDTRFLQLYEVCFDEIVRRTHYVKHHLSPWNSRHQPTTRPYFIQGAFFPDTKISNLYTFETQKRTLGRILGSPERADALLDVKKDLFLARGHLAAKADFFFSHHQRASFWFINAAPQWQKFNAVNWQRVETGVRDLIARRNMHVTVYTGTYGVLELADANGDMKEIYLDFDPDGDDEGRVPVPKIYYKILHDEENDAGIVLVGVNNPHATLEEIEEGYIFCNDLSDRINWVQWKRDYIPGGYSYACDVNEFNAMTKHLPLPKISRLLV
ncbi:uncharacterized protein LOC129768548 [Toxorhynchites rutilus septentrionalis]|uniref:uncharacterized protein LOC129768548 n=1 Tax=Toxorhynchites rutilus septentrionalis TaxID=329112 RepID=UPI0024791C07|nr:uncharacterized protein LOC129768548 [Toxorhynchites rutilus septentrionalis]